MKSLARNFLFAILWIIPIFAFAQDKQAGNTWKDTKDGFYKEIFMDSGIQLYGRKNLIDAYKVKGNPGSVSKYHNIYVVYTKEAETADQYIEKTVHDMARKYQVTVATSDALEQMIIWGQGATRLSALGLKEEVEQASREMRETWQEKQPGEKHRPFGELLQERAGKG